MELLVIGSYFWDLFVIYDSNLLGGEEGNYLENIFNKIWINILGREKEVKIEEK